jgi:HAD superfamily hydrolase (TIGR01509 family)
VIFDLDQTIASTASLLYDSWNAAMIAIGRDPVTPEGVIAHFGPPEHVALRRVVGDKDYPAAFDAYLRHYHQHHDSIVKLYDGVADALAWLSKRGARVGMVTGKGRATTEITLTRLGVREHFDMVLTGDELKNAKPDPEGIQRILDQFDLKPSDAIMIGDMPADVESARSAGAQSGAALWDCEWRDRLRASDPDVEFETVAAMRAFLEAEVA